MAIVIATAMAIAIGTAMAIAIAIAIAIAMAIAMAITMATILWWLECWPYLQQGPNVQYLRIGIVQAK